MIIRIMESKGLDIFTIQELLNNADHQANFHPETRWILRATLKTQTASNVQGRDVRPVLDYQVKWIGCESVVLWLLSNQVKFQVISYDLLKEEQDALDFDNEEVSSYPNNPNKLN